MSDKPWYKRYPSNVIGGFMGLTLEERGAYATLLEYLYDRREPLPSNMRMLAGYLDVSVRKAESVISSLVRKGKLYRLEDGRYTNPKYEREAGKDAKTSDLRAEIGSEGGRKSAEKRKNAKENNVGGQANAKQGASLDRGQKTETRKQKERKEGSTTTKDASASSVGGGIPSQPVAAVVLSELDLAVQAYNEGAEKCPGGMGAGWSKCISLTDNRKAILRARLAEVGLEGWRAAVVRGVRSDFLSGRAKRSPGHERWGIDIGWLAKAENFAKVTEGRYDNDRGRAQPRGQDSARAGLMDFLNEGEPK